MYHFVKPIQVRRNVLHQDKLLLSLGAGVLQKLHPKFRVHFIIGSDDRPLDFGYLPGTSRYMENRIKGSGYTSLHGLNYESVGYRDDYYTNEAYPQLVGQGQVRVNGQDAELTCQFPPTYDIVSVMNLKTISITF